MRFQQQQGGGGRRRVSVLNSGSRVGAVSGTHIVLQSCMVSLGFRCDHPHVIEEAQRDEGAAQGHTAYTDGVAI